MCRVTVEVDQEMLRDLDPALDSTAAIRNWVQQLVNVRMQQMKAGSKDDMFDICKEEIGLYLQPTDLRNIEMVGEEAETMSIEEARMMLHQTIREEYAKA